MTTTNSTIVTTITTDTASTMNDEKGEEKEEGMRGGKKSIHYIIESRDKENKYLKEFIGSELCVEFQEKAEWRSWAWSKKTSHLKKEIVESYAVAKSVDAVLAAMRAGTRKSKKVVFFDMASGKGFTSVVLAKRFPNATVHMLDNNRNMNLAHLNAVPTVQFKNIDLFSEEAETLIMDALVHHDGFGVMVGMHLCGNLSRRAIEMWTNIMTKGEQMQENSFNLGLVLSPCCLPHKVRVPKRKYNDFGYWIKSTQRQFGIDGYDLWATSLYNLVCSHVGPNMRSVSKRFFRDESLLTPTNWFILVTPMDSRRTLFCQLCEGT
jgi:hypothetical protein